MNASRFARKLAVTSAFALVLALLTPIQAWAAPKIVTSIRPVQALVYAVTDETGAPDVVLEAGQSPHAFALKPSQAELLADADIVFWIGPQLETALEGPLGALAGKAKVVKLLDAPGLDLLYYENDGHGHDQDHGHGPIDPHVWLSPKNAEVLVDFIASELIALEPGNARIYTRNAKRAKSRLKLLHKQMDKILSHTRDVPYLVQHDGFGYLARDFAMTEVGQLQLLPGREPGAKHLSELRALIAERGVRCILTEPQFTSQLAQQLSDETGVRIGEVDPMGKDLVLGPALPLTIIQNVVLGMDQCLYTKPVDTPSQQ